MSLPVHENVDERFPIVQAVPEIAGYSRGAATGCATLTSR
jgi:hypothetical protein